MRKNCLLLFVKYPEAGRVKTRVGKVIGYRESALLYKILAEDNFREINSLDQDIDIIVAYDPTVPEEKIKDWLPGASSYLPQAGAGLSERLPNAFQFAFQRGAKQVMALGSDTLGLTWNIIATGFKALENNDCVIGPAKDGGYYLIGVSRCEPALFQNIPWSSVNVLLETLKIIRQRELSYYLLDELEDLDEVKENENFQSLIDKVRRENIDAIKQS